MSYLKQMFNKITRDIGIFNEQEVDYNCNKINRVFDGKCGFTGQDIDNKQIYKSYKYYSVRGISYKCDRHTKDLYGNKTTKEEYSGFLPLKQQKVEVAVTKEGVQEFIANQNKKAWIGNNIPVFIILLLMLINVGVGLFIASFHLAKFFMGMPAGGLFSIGIILGVGIILPIFMISSFVSWFKKMRKIKKAGTDISCMTKEQREFIDSTIEDKVKSKITSSISELWYNPNKSTSIIGDSEWNLDTHDCISRYDHMLFKKDMLRDIEDIHETIVSAQNDSNLYQSLLNNKMIIG